MLQNCAPLGIAALRRHEKSTRDPSPTELRAQRYTHLHTHTQIYTHTPYTSVLGYAWALMVLCSSLLLDSFSPVGEGPGQSVQAAVCVSGPRAQLQSFCRCIWGCVVDDFQNSLTLGGRPKFSPSPPGPQVRVWSVCRMLPLSDQHCPAHTNHARRNTLSGSLPLASLSLSLSESGLIQCFVLRSGLI